MLSAIDNAWDERVGKTTFSTDTRLNTHHGGTPTRDYQKLLLVVNTMTLMPDAPEKLGVLTRFRLNTTLSARLLPADHLQINDSENPYDPATINGTARKTLKAMLIKIIHRL